MPIAAITAVIATSNRVAYAVGSAQGFALRAFIVMKHHGTSAAARCNMWHAHRGICHRSPPPHVVPQPRIVLRTADSVPMRPVTPWQ